MGGLQIDPPVLNSANPWCSTLEQLQELYASEYTGAVTTRTSLLQGFPHDDSIHQFAFYNPSSHEAGLVNADTTERPDETGSLNTLGYSPTPLQGYLSYVKTISDSLPDQPASQPRASPRARHKPFIISVTGTVEEVVECYRMITDQQKSARMVLAMEVNLSCPNIVNKPPPAYDSATLFKYLSALKKVRCLTSVPSDESHRDVGDTIVPIGIKTPPYTYNDQFRQLIHALLQSARAEPTNLPCPVSFITATNTLGSSLLLSSVKIATKASWAPPEALLNTLNSANGSGIGGLAGAPLHPLALGNVYTIKQMLVQNIELAQIQVIGVGGVEDSQGVQRMKAAGASAVGVGTALGRKGISIFEHITKAL